MALVKKLQLGNKIPIDQNALAEEFEKNISSYKLRSKDERLVRNALVKLRDYDPTSEGKSFAVDQTNQSYTITGPGSEAFTGSPDEVKQSWLSGNLRIKNEQDAMSVAVAIYNSSLNNLKTKSSQTETQPIDKQKRSIIDLSNFGITRDAYGSEKEYTTKLSNILTDEGRQQFVFDLARKAANSYLKEYETNGKNYEYSDLANVQALSEILKKEKPTWEEFSNASYKLGWSPTSFLLQSSDKEKLKEQEVIKKNEDYSNTLIGKGITNPQQWIAGGYTELESNYNSSDNPEISKWVNDNIQKAKGIVLKNPKTGSNIIINRSGIIPEFRGTDPFKPGYGYIGRQTDSGFEVLGPDQTKEMFEDTNLNLDEAKELKTNLVGTFYGWSSDEEGGEYKKNILGHRDFTKRIEWILPTGNRKILKLNNDNKYVDEQGKVIDLKILGFGDKPSRKYTNYETLFSDIPSIAPELDQSKYELASKYVLSQVSPVFKNSFPTTWQNDLAILKKHIARNPNDSNPEMTRLAGKLKWVLQNNKDIQSNENIKNDVLGTIIGYHKILNRVPSQKKGGVIKAQSGTKVKEINEYMDQLRVKAKDPKNSTRKFRDTTGTWKGQTDTENALDVASTAGALASFIPGVGAIGASVSFGADLAKDLQDGKINNWGTHALNAGFITLSAIGLGGLKTLLKGAQVAGKAGNIAKSAAKFEKIGAKSFSSAEKEGLEKIVNLSKNLKANTVNDLENKINAIKNLNKKASAKEAFEEGLKVLGTIESSSTRILGNKTLGAISKKVTDKLPSIANKSALLGLRVGTMLPGAMALPSTLKTGFTEGWEYTKPGDIKNIVLAGAVGKNWLKDRRILKAIDKQASPETKGVNTTTINLGDEKITLNKVISVPKTGIFGKKKVSETNMDQVRKDIAKVAEDQGIKIDSKKLEKISSDDIFVNKPKDSKRLVLDESPKSVTGDRSIDARDYELAKKYLGEKNIKVTEKTKYKYTPGVKFTGKVYNKPTKNKPIDQSKKRKVINKHEYGGSIDINKQDPKEVKKSNLWSKLKGSVNETDIANIGMYLNTLSANKKASAAQKKAAMASIITLPTMQKEYIRTSSPLSLETNKQAANVRSQVRSIGSSTSDLNRAIGVLLQGNKQANELILKGKIYDEQANAKLQEEQRASNSKINAYNNEVIGRNKMSIANAEKSINLVDANQVIANNANTTNLLTALERNIPYKKYTALSKELSDLQKDPEYLKIVEEYNKTRDPKTLQELKDKYTKETEKLTTSTTTGTFEDSSYNKNHQQRLKETEELLKPFVKRFREKESELNAATSRMYLRKSGGSLSKKDRIEIETAKANLKAAQKDTELAYKAIMHNNEMLQKALIKIFK